jgi:hypothetical protein
MPAMISTRQLHSSPKVTGISMVKVGKLYRPSTVERLYILWSPINRQSAMVTVRGGHMRTSRFTRAYPHTDAADTCSNMCVPLLLCICSRSGYTSKKPDMAKKPSTCMPIPRAPTKKTEVSVSCNLSGSWMRTRYWNSITTWHATTQADNTTRRPSI